MNTRVGLGVFLFSVRSRTCYYIPSLTRLFSSLFVRYQSIITEISVPQVPSIIQSICVFCSSDCSISLEVIERPSSASFAVYSSTMNLMLRYCVLSGPKVESALRKDDWSFVRSVALLNLMVSCSWHA